MSDPSRRDVLRAMVVAGVVSTGIGMGGASATPAAGTIALTGVTVIDVTGSRRRRDATVLVRDGRILAVGHGIQIPAGAAVIDLPRKFVIPGLCDAHVHSMPFERVSPPLYLVHGITTVREMSGSQLLHQWRDRIERGELLGPRSVIASRIIDGAPTIGDPAVFVEVATEAQAREAVRQAKQDGADFVKVYSRLPRHLHRVIADEARRRQIAFAGHLPDAVPLRVASEMGQRSTEHLYATWYDTSTREAELRARIAELTLGQGDYVTWLHETHKLEWDAATSYSPSKAAKVLAVLARNQTRVVPTLSAYRVLDRPDAVALTDERLQYVPDATVEGWRWALEHIIKAGWTPEETAQREALYRRRLAFVRALAEAGVPVLAGTDGGDLPFVFPGSGLHDELDLLVQAGLSPLAALRAATIEPARMLGMDDTIGTVENGKVADLVILDADPLTDIRNTTRIHAVVTRGQIITSKQRSRMLADIAAAAAELSGPPG